jgi:hypothetical protein
MENEEYETEFFQIESWDTIVEATDFDVIEKTYLCESMLITLKEIEKATINFDLARVVCQVVQIDSSLEVVAIKSWSFKKERSQEPSKQRNQ